MAGGGNGNGHGGESPKDLARRTLEQLEEIARLEQQGVLTTSTARNWKMQVLCAPFLADAFPGPPPKPGFACAGCGKPIPAGWQPFVLEDATGARPPANYCGIGCVVRVFRREASP